MVFDRELAVSVAPAGGEGDGLVPGDVGIQLRKIGASHLDLERDIEILHAFDDIAVHAHAGEAGTRAAGPEA